METYASEWVSGWNKLETVELHFICINSKTAVLPFIYKSSRVVNDLHNPQNNDFATIKEGNPISEVIICFDTKFKFIHK